MAKVFTEQRALTAKQQAFVDYYTDSTNKQTYNNGLESARAAGYKGNDNTLAVVACENISKPNVKQTIANKVAERQAKIEYNYEIAAKLLRIQHDKADKANKITEAISALRELNDISGLHKQRFVDETERTRELTASEEAEARRLAGIRLKQGA